MFLLIIDLYMMYFQISEVQMIIILLIKNKYLLFPLLLKIYKYIPNIKLALKVGRAKA